MNLMGSVSRVRVPEWCSDVNTTRTSVQVLKRKIPRAATPSPGGALAGGGSGAFPPLSASPCNPLEGGLGVGTA